LELHGWAILWSPELLNEEYTFFSYFWAEPLRLEEDEWQAINELSERLQKELRDHIKYSTKNRYNRKESLSRLSLL